MTKKINHKRLVKNLLSLLEFKNTLRMVTAVFVVTIFVYSSGYSQKSEINNINLYIEQGEYEQAKEIAYQLLNNTEVSQTAEVSYYVGKALYEYVKQDGQENNEDFRKNVLDAQKAFAKCLELDDEAVYTAQCLTRQEGLVAIVQNKAIEPYKGKQYEKALMLFEILIELNPVANNYKLAAVSADALGQKQKALDYFTTLVEKEKQEINVYKRMVKLAAELKLNDEKQSAYLDIAMKAYPLEPAFLHDQVAIEQNSENPNPVVILGLYEKILELDSSDVVVLFNIGVIYYNNAALSFNKGKKEEAKTYWNKAKEYWERAYELDPSDADTKNYLNDVYSKLGEETRKD